MGQTASHSVSYNLYHSIRSEVSDLINDYKIWLNKETCNNITNVYRNKLLKYNTEDLRTVHIAIENKEPLDISKEELCDRIISHYTTRISILEKLYSNIGVWNKQIFSLNSNKMCRGLTKPEFTLEKCTEKGGFWIDNMAMDDFINTLKSINMYDVWKNIINKLNKAWNTNLHKIRKTVRHIKNLENNITTTRLTELNDHVDILIKKINSIIEIYALLISNFG